MLLAYTIGHVELIIILLIGLLFVAGVGGAVGLIVYMASRD